MNQPSEWVHFQLDVDVARQWAAECHGLVSSETSQYSDCLLAVLCLESQMRRLDVFSVIQELQFLSGIRDDTRTKKHTQFQRAPLKPFFHKHFFQAAFIVSNLVAELGLDRGGNGRMDDVIQRVIADREDPNTECDRTNFLAHEVTVGAFTRRADRKKLTGEWIVFAQKESTRYFLGIGSHSEGDHRLYERLRRECSQQFPMLFE